MRFQNEFGRSVATCVLSIYNLKLDRDCGQHSNSQSTYLCVLLRNQNWLKIGQLTSIARDLYFLSPNLETQWSKIFKRGYGQTGSKAHLPAVFSIFDRF